MKLIPVDDPADSRLAAYRDIRERDLVGRQGRFIAEGKVVLAAMLAAGRFAAESVLVLDSRLAGMSDLLASAADDLPVYVASRAAIDAIAGFPMHRGVLAVGLRRPPEAIEAMLAALPRRALILVLVGIANHDNVGAIFRNAAAFGADAVLLDPTCCDPLYRKAIRVSVGAALKVPFAVGSGSEAMIGAIQAAGFRLLALSPAGRDDIRDIAPAPRIALMLGTEGEGLPGTLLSRLDTARIAMAPGFDSLNVAAASAIALHELSGKMQAPLG
jgi:tRNA G18 (ribose-2'-O)-methylase SpoU